MGWKVWDGATPKMFSWNWVEARSMRPARSRLHISGLGVQIGLPKIEYLRSVYQIFDIFLLICNSMISVDYTYNRKLCKFLIGKSSSWYICSRAYVESGLILGNSKTRRLMLMLRQVPEQILASNPDVTESESEYFFCLFSFTIRKLLFNSSSHDTMPHVQTTWV